MIYLFNTDHNGYLEGIHIDSYAKSVDDLAKIALDYFKEYFWYTDEEPTIKVEDDKLVIYQDGEECCVYLIVKIPEFSA